MLFITFLVATGEQTKFYSSLASGFFAPVMGISFTVLLIISGFIMN